MIATLSGRATATEPDTPHRALIPLRELIPVMDRSPQYQRGAAQHQAGEQAHLTSGRLVSVPIWQQDPSPGVDHSGAVLRESMVGDHSNPHEMTQATPPAAIPWAQSSSEPSTSAARPLRAWVQLQPAPLHDTQSQGRPWWDRVRVGKDNFLMEPYPLDIPSFRHLYRTDHLLPINFEETMHDRSRHSQGIRYHPEPQILAAIRQRIWNQLRSDNIEPRLVAGLTSPLTEGEYLWPPVRGDLREKLDIPSDSLERLLNVIRNRVRQHSPDSPKLFHMEVPVQGQTRHILMAAPRVKSFVSEAGRWRETTLWFFYEAKANAVHRRWYFLGATYLPAQARNALLTSEVMRYAVLDRHTLPW